MAQSRPSSPWTPPRASLPVGSAAGPYLWRGRELHLECHNTWKSLCTRGRTTVFLDGRTVAFEESMNDPSKGTGEFELWGRTHRLEFECWKVGLWQVGFKIRVDGLDAVEGTTRISNWYTSFLVPILVTAPLFGLLVASAF